MLSISLMLIALTVIALHLPPSAPGLAAIAR